MARIPARRRDWRTGLLWLTSWPARNAQQFLWHHQSLQWYHNERDCVSNHQPRDRLLNRLFRHRSTKTSMLPVSLAFVWGIHRWPANSPHKGPVTRKMFPFDDVIIYTLGKKGCYTPLKTIKPMWIELLCFHLAEIGMIWTRDCSPTKSDTTLGRHSMQGQVGSSSSETTV